MRWPECVAISWSTRRFQRLFESCPFGRNQRQNPKNVLIGEIRIGWVTLEILFVQRLTSDMTRESSGRSVAVWLKLQPDRRGGGTETEGRLHSKRCGVAKRSKAESNDQYWLSQTRKEHGWNSCSVSRGVGLLRISDHRERGCSVPAERDPRRKCGSANDGIWWRRIKNKTFFFFFYLLLLFSRE